MKGLAVVQVLVSACAFAADSATLVKPAAAGRSITASTSPPEFPADGGAVLFPMPEGQYGAMVKALEGKAKLVPMLKAPGNLTADARYGFGFAYSGTNRSFVLDGNDTLGYVFYLDRNADGDLGNDPPLRFEKQGGGNGRDGAVFEETLTESRDGRVRSRTVRVRVSVTDFAMRGQEHAQKVLVEESGADRAGTIDVDGRPVPFALSGHGGIFDEDVYSIFFDTDGDGTLDRSQHSTERYEVGEKYVNLAGRSFEFKVDRYGDQVTLLPLAGKRSDRAVLTPGHKAPEFSATGVSGAPESLAKYRGKVLLLEFWGIWCSPCVREAPTLVGIYDRYHARGFEILGVHNGKTADEVAAFSGKHKMTWSQVLETEKDPLHQVYRVRGWPTYFLIDKDGTILADDANPTERLEPLLEKALPAEPAAVTK